MKSTDFACTLLSVAQWERAPYLARGLTRNTLHHLVFELSMSFLCYGNIHYYVRSLRLLIRVSQLQNK